MYTETERKAVADIIKQLAHVHHVEEAQVRADIANAIDAGRNNSDPAVQVRWTTFHCAGAEPTLEEFILWAAATIIKMLDDGP